MCAFMLNSRALLALVGGLSVWPFVLAACASDDQAVRQTPASTVTAEPTTGAPPSSSMRPDPHSFARPDEVAVKHVALDLSVDFAASVISGTATLDIHRMEGHRAVDRVAEEDHGRGRGEHQHGKDPEQDGEHAVVCAGGALCAASSGRKPAA